MKLKNNIVSAILVAVITLSPLNFLFAYNQATAQSYLQAHSNNSWSTMALSVLGVENISTDHLKNISGSNAIDYSAPILALTSINKNPRTFGNEDYVAKLKTFYSGGQLGDSSTLNDDMFGLLALRSAGESLTDSVVNGTKNYLLQNQNSDGGWGFVVSGSSDSNMTSVAIAALVTSGISSTDTKIQSALNYLKTAQNSDGGFTYDPNSSFGTDSDSSSTSWAMWALTAAGVDQASWSKNGNTPKSYLESNQASSGYFKYQSSSSEDAFSSVTTAYAVIALAGKTLPLTIGTSVASEEFNFRIEGSAETVCSGKAAGPTALDLVKNASTQCGFTYNIQSTGFGPYLNKINEDTASGLSGWMYLVNNTSPDVGSSDYILKTGETVLWYFGDFGWKPTRLSLNQTTISSGQSTQAAVEKFENGSWSPLPEGIVLFGTQETTTNSSGTATISSSDGYYKVFAEKSGYIRSNQVLLQIGEPSSSTINLSANIKSGQVNGTSTEGSISFIVNTSGLDFGDLSSGQNSSKQVSISNNGNVNIKVESIVSGDSLFKDNLKINQSHWQHFETDINSGQSQNTNVELTVPQNYSGTKGQKSGQLVFWASVNN